MSTCPTCRRPKWDGGHALNERECSQENGEVCTLHNRLNAALDFNRTNWTRLDDAKLLLERCGKFLAQAPVRHHPECSRIRGVCGAECVEPTRRELRDRVDAWVFGG